MLRPMGRLGGGWSVAKGCHYREMGELMLRRRGQDVGGRVIVFCGQEDRVLWRLEREI